MSCCSPAAKLADATIDRSRTANAELLLQSRDIGGGLRQSDLSVPAIHCGGCIQTIEKALDTLRGVEQATANSGESRKSLRPTLSPPERLTARPSVITGSFSGSPPLTAVGARTRSV